MKTNCSNISITGMLYVLFFLILSGCGDPINSVGDPNFTRDGYSLDTLKETMKAEVPSALGFYIEVSGSMNGFFRSNKATRFKKDVWSVVSNFGGNDVFVLSNSGANSKKYDVQDFRSKMNKGAFVSNKETMVPTMLETILSSLDYKNGQCAVLISDMKYSPEGQKDMKVLLSQYQSDIRNTIGKYSDIAISLIMAKSDFLAANGSPIEEDSPYYFLILGKDSNVAFMRNRIATLLEDNKDYGECIEAGFDYKAPLYTFGIPDNAIQFKEEPTFINYDTEYSDTCTIVLNLDLSAYRWLIADEEILRQNISVKSCYGSDVCVGNINLEVDNNYNKEFKRKALAKVELKVSNMIAADSDVIEWSLNHPEFMISNEFTEIISASFEKDYKGSFSVDKFIAGVFNARQNKWDSSPNRILISKKE